MALTAEILKRQPEFQQSEVCSDFARNPNKASTLTRAARQLEILCKEVETEQRRLVAGTGQLFFTFRAISTQAKL